MVTVGIGGFQVTVRHLSHCLAGWRLFIFQKQRKWWCNEEESQLGIWENPDSKVQSSRELTGKVHKENKVVSLFNFLVFIHIPHLVVWRLGLLWATLRLEHPLWFASSLYCSDLFTGRLDGNECSSCIHPDLLAGCLHSFPLNISSFFHAFSCHFQTTKSISFFKSRFFMLGWQSNLIYFNWANLKFWNVHPSCKRVTVWIPPHSIRSSNLAGTLLCVWISVLFQHVNSRE